MRYTEFICICRPFTKHIIYKRMKLLRWIRYLCMDCMRALFAIPFTQICQAVRHWNAHKIFHHLFSDFNSVPIILISFFFLLLFVTMVEFFVTPVSDFKLSRFIFSPSCNDSIFTNHWKKLKPTQMHRINFYQLKFQLDLIDLQFEKCAIFFFDKFTCWFLFASKSFVLTMLLNPACCRWHRVLPLPNTSTKHLHPSILYNNRSIVLLWLSHMFCAIPFAVCGK